MLQCLLNLLLVFQAGYHPREKGFKTHRIKITYCPCMKIDPKYAFFCMFFFFFKLSVVFFQKIVNMTKNTPFSHFCTFLHPKRCMHVHFLVLKNNPNYVIFPLLLFFFFFTRMISNFKYKCPRDCMQFQNCSL